MLTGWFARDRENPCALGLFGRTSGIPGISDWNFMGRLLCKRRRRHVAHSLEFQSPFPSQEGHRRLGR